jgi:hypothetical protein
MADSAAAAFCNSRQWQVHNDELNGRARERVAMRHCTYAQHGRARRRGAAQRDPAIVESSQVLHRHWCPSVLLLPLRLGQAFPEEVSVRVGVAGGGWRW